MALISDSDISSREMLYISEEDKMTKYGLNVNYTQKISSRQGAFLLLRGGGDKDKTQSFEIISTNPIKSHTFKSNHLPGGIGHFDVSNKDKSVLGYEDEHCVFMVAKMESKFSNKNPTIKYYNSDLEGKYRYAVFEDEIYAIRSKSRKKSQICKVNIDGGRATFEKIADTKFNLLNVKIKYLMRTAIIYDNNHIVSFNPHKGKIGFQKEFEDTSVIKPFFGSEGILCNVGDVDKKIVHKYDLKTGRKINTFKNVKIMDSKNGVSIVNHKGDIKIANFDIA